MANEKKKITPYKGGRTENRLVQMTPEVKEMTEYVLEEMSMRAGAKVSLSDVWENRVRYLVDWLRHNPGLPLDYAGRIVKRTGQTDFLPPLPPDDPGEKEPQP